MNRMRKPLIRALLALSTLSIGAALAQDYVIDWHRIDGGGEMFSTGDMYELSGTIGQADAGAMNDGTYSLTGGFWFAQVRGDCNYDAGVDLLDFQYFPACLSGPNGGLGAGCGCLDFDVDEDVDLADFAKFQVAFN